MRSPNLMTLPSLMIYTTTRNYDYFTEKKIFWVTIQTKINLGLDLEFDSIHFGIEIKKCLKFLTQKFLGLKYF